MGCGGKRPDNVERELFRWARRAGISAEAWLKKYYVPIRIKRPECDHEETIDFPVLLPHEWIGEMWHKSLSLFTKTILTTGHDGIQRFWDSVAHCTWCNDIQCDKSFLVPIRSFGDEASIGGTYLTTKFLVLSASSLLARYHGLDKHMLYAIIPVDWLIPHKTLFDLLHPFWWSCVAAEDGHWPTKNHLQQPFTKGKDRYRYNKAHQGHSEIAGPYRFWKCMDSGDYEYIVNKFGVQGYSNRSCCHRCFATKCSGPDCYANFFANARHHLAQRTTAVFLSEVVPLNPLCMTSWWCLEMLRNDMMHGTYQGNGSRVVANTIVELCHEGFWGKRGFANLPLAHLAASNFSKQHGFSKLPKFTREKLGHNNISQYPELKSKAYHCRILISWVAQLTASQVRRTPHASLHMKMRATCCWALSTFCWLVDEFGNYLTDNQIRQLQFHGQTFLITYQHLAATSYFQGTCLWSLKPKLHQFQHALKDLWVDRLNPRLYWCFGDESMIGILKRSAAKVHRSTSAFGNSVLNRHLLRVGIHVRRSKRGVKAIAKPRCVRRSVLKRWCR